MSYANYIIDVEPGKTYDLNIKLTPLNIVIFNLSRVRNMRLTIKSDNSVVQLFDRFMRLIASGQIIDDLFIVYDNYMYMVTNNETIAKIQILAR